MGERHVQAIRRLGATVAATLDPADAPYGVAVHPELADVHHKDEATFFKALERFGVDALVVATTADRHEDLLARGLAAGVRRFMIEKPVCQSHAGVLRMAEASAAASARVVVNHGRRYCPNTARLKSLAGSDEAGDLRSIAIRMGGGSLGCVGTHWFDLCNNLMRSTPLSVHAFTTEPASNPRGGRFRDPGGIVTLRYPGNRRAVVDMGDDVGIVAGASFVYERAEVAWTSEGGPWTFRARKVEDRVKPLSAYGIPLYPLPFESTPPDIVGYAASAIADALADGPVISGLVEAEATMAVFAATMASADRGIVVGLPLDPDASAAIYPIP
jgi:predicted dehydrogenase